MSGNIKKKNKLTELSKKYKESTDNLKRNKKSSNTHLANETQRKVDLELYAIGQRIRHQRKLANMTQDAAGKALGVSKQIISLHENGTKISIEYLEKYSCLYACSIELFFTDEPVTTQGLHKINQAAAMSRGILKIKSWYQRGSFKAFEFLDVDFREIQRWEAFARQNVSCDKGTNDTHGIRSVPLVQFIRIALELEVPIAEIFFEK